MVAVTPGYRLLNMNLINVVVNAISTDESTEERSAESDPEESPIKETQETPSVSAKPPKLIQTGQTWWPVFLLMFAGAGLLVFGLYKRSKENIDHE